MPYSSKESDLPTHPDSNRKGDIVVQRTIGHYDKLVLDFSMTHPRVGNSKIHAQGTWKSKAVESASTRKDAKHAIQYEQSSCAFLSLTADTYGRLSEDFVRFL